MRYVTFEETSTQIDIWATVVLKIVAMNVDGEESAFESNSNEREFVHISQKLFVRNQDAVILIARIA